MGSSLSARSVQVASLAQGYALFTKEYMAANVRVL